ncbi:MAG: GDSL-type esterase/lipase family protein [Candidatus Omnitrophica bacterium]|nr:GDSL-type esterase/lipase family protein [Candidatus Omnitrophota bacterium]
MAKIIKIKFIYFCAILIIFIGCVPKIKNLNNSGKNIICFGDSITEGAGVLSYENYPSVLEKFLKRKVINAGVGGDTTFSALKRLEKDVLSNDPFLVIIELGGNDFLQKIPREITIKNLKEIILKIQSKNAIVVLCDISDSFVLKSYHNDLKKLAKETGSIFVSYLLAGILNNPTLKVDYLHPNKEGHYIIAERIYNAIKKYLN